MADYGLLIKNNNSEIQIDSTYRNLSLDESDTSVSIINNNTGAGYHTRITLASSALIPLVLTRPNTDRFVTVRNYYKSGSNFAGADIVTERNQSTTIDWKSYRENRVASGESYGLLVYNSAGDLCFDAGKNYFKIHSVHTGISLNSPPQEVAYGDYQDITHAGISNPYYILSPCSYWMRTYGGPYEANLWLIGLKQISSTVIRVGWFVFGHVGPLSPGIDEGNNPLMTLIVCDVT